MSHASTTPPAQAGESNAGSQAATGAPTYDAFISYSQRGDKAVARALRTVIQTIGKPWWKVRSLNIFLDATSLSAAPSLWQGIEEKLDRSRYLILLASPEAAASKWVDKEVSHFLATSGADRLLIALTGGELEWDDTAGDFRQAATALPPSLRGVYSQEPLWVDLRAFRDDASSANKGNQVFLQAALDLAATIKGVEKADLYSEELRRQRRSIQIAYGIATAVAGLAVAAGIAAWIAVQNAERATRNFGIAKSTVDQVVFDIAQGLRNVEGMRVESLRTILSRAEAAVSRLADLAPDDTDVQRSRGSMLNEFGDTYRAAGDGAAAAEAYDESLAVSRALVARDPENIPWQRDLSISLIKTGDSRLAAGDTAGALADYQESLAIVRRFDDAGAPGDIWQRDYATALGRIGDVKRRTGDTTAALAAYEEGLSIARDLVARDPAHDEWANDVAVRLDKIGDLKRDSGDAEGALAAFAESLATLRGLVAADVGNTAWQSDAAVVLGKISDMKSRVGDAAGALAADEEGLAIRRRLAALDPDNAGWQRDLSAALNRIGQLRIDAGDVAGAQAAFEEGLAIVGGLADADTTNLSVQRSASVSFIKVGDVKRRQGDMAEALEAYEAGLTIRRRMAEIDPDAVQWQRDVSVGLNKVGDTRLETGDIAGALAAYDEGLDIRRRLIEINPSNREWQRDLSVSLDRVGDIRLQNDDRSGAAATYQESLDLRRGLLAGEPDNTQWQTDLVVGLWKVQSADDDMDRRRSMLDEALSILTDPDRAGYRSTRWNTMTDTVGWELARVLALVGDARLDEGDADGALEAFGERLDIRRRIAAVDPSNAAWQDNVVGALGRIAYGRLFAGQFEGSEEISREALALDPTKKWLEINLAHALLFQGRIGEADAIYLGNRGVALGDDAWEDVVVADFNELRAGGVDHPHMVEVERIFAGAAEPAPDGQAGSVDPE